MSTERRLVMMMMMLMLRRIMRMMIRLMRMMMLMRRALGVLHGAVIPPLSLHQPFNAIPASRMRKAPFITGTISWPVLLRLEVVEPEREVHLTRSTALLMY